MKASYPMRPFYDDIFLAQLRRVEQLRAAIQAKHDAATLAIVDALVTETPLRFIYRDQDGVLSLREAIPTAIEKCKNGRVVVQAFDLNRQGTRKFRMNEIALLG